MGQQAPSTRGQHRVGAGLRVGLRMGLVSLVGALALLGVRVEAQGLDGDALLPGDGPLSVEETEALVRGRYYEGMPRELAARIGPEGCARLVDMLGDPGETRHHDQVLVALGVCAPEGGLEAIDAWLQALPEGELDRPRFKAWLAVSHALAALAEHDPRAVARLEARMTAPEAPRFRHGRHRGARLLRLQRDGAATGLAETGLPAARAALDRAQLHASDGGFVAHLEALRGLHRERALERGRASGGRR